MADVSSLLQLPFYFQYHKLQVFLPKHLFNYSFRNIKPVIILMEGAETEIKLSWAHVFSWQLVISWMEKTPVQWGILIIMFQISPLIYFPVFKPIHRWKANLFRASPCSPPRTHGGDAASALTYGGQAWGLSVQRVLGAGGSGHSSPCPRGHLRHGGGSALASGATAASAGTSRTSGAGQDRWCWAGPVVPSWSRAW